MPGEQRAASRFCRSLALTGLPLRLQGSSRPRHHVLRPPQARTVARPSPSRCAGGAAAAPARCRLLPLPAAILLAALCLLPSLHWPLSQSQPLPYVRRLCRTSTVPSSRQAGRQNLPGLAFPCCCSGGNGQVLTALLSLLPAGAQEGA